MLTAVRAASSLLRTTKQGSIRDLGQKLVDRERMFVPRKTYHVIGDTSASPANNEAATAVQMSRRGAMCRRRRAPIDCRWTRSCRGCGIRRSWPATAVVCRCARPAPTSARSCSPCVRVTRSMSGRGVHMRAVVRPVHASSTTSGFRSKWSKMKGCHSTRGTPCISVRPTSRSSG